MEAVPVDTVLATLKRTYRFDVSKGMNSSFVAAVAEFVIGSADANDVNVVLSVECSTENVTTPAPADWEILGTITRALRPRRGVPVTRSRLVPENPVDVVIRV